MSESIDSVDKPAGQQEHQFQAETQQLLHILIHSLYSHKEIFLRELLSNSVDALDKMRFQHLTDKVEDETPLEIRLETDETKGVLTIIDNGIGMTGDELVQNIGTIARSGTAKFLSQLSQDDRKNSSLIGQFGVGFYSVFMVADRVRIVTRSHQQDAKAVTWESEGKGSYTIGEHAEADRGTRIEIFLKKEEREFAQPARLREIVKRHSHYLPYPVKLGESTINEVTALWIRPKSEITDEDYAEFYKFHTGKSEEPLSTLHFLLDTPFQLNALVYFPRSGLDVLGMPEAMPALSLYSKRVLIQRECKDLLPDYMRFLRGLVDVEDLPLNVSRESFQQDRVLLAIRKQLVRKIFSHLKDLSKKEPETYKTFIQNFGPFLKQGFQSDFDNRDKIVELLRFNSSTCEDASLSVSLADYLERKPEDQKKIFYLSGATRDVLLKSPHLEVFQEKGLEVLFLTDPLDDLVLTTLRQYKDVEFEAADQADVGLSVDEKADEKEPLAFRGKLSNLVDRMKEVLEGRVVDVRESKRLTDSPCALMNPQDSATAGIQKLMSLMDKDFQLSQRILEINPKNPIVRNLAEMYHQDPSSEEVERSAHLLLDSALFLEGLPVSSEEMVPRLRKTLESLTRLQSDANAKPPQDD